jgi:hypothetical protein
MAPRELSAAQSSKTEVLITGTRPQVTKFNNATADSTAIQFAGALVSLARILFIFLVSLLISILLLTIMWLS